MSTLEQAPIWFAAKGYWIQAHNPLSNAEAKGILEEAFPEEKTFIAEIFAEK